MTGIAKEDLRDADVVDATELASDGTTVYITGATVVSTTSGTKRIVFSGIDLVHDLDERAEPKDTVVLSGTTAADGTYTIANIIDSVTVDVEEAIADSTSGTANFQHPPGASKVGLDPTGLTQTSATNVQDAIKDIDGAVSGGGLTEAAHELLDTQVHALAETREVVITRTNGKVTDILNRTTGGSPLNIRKTEVTRTAGRVTQILVRHYDAAGAEITAKRMTGALNRTAGRVTTIDWVEGP